MVTVVKITLDSTVAGYSATLIEHARSEFRPRKWEDEGGAGNMHLRSDAVQAQMVRKWQCNGNVSLLVVDQHFQA